MNNTEKRSVFLEIKSMYSALGFEVPDTSLQMVTEMLAKYPFDRTIQAIQETAMTCKFRPKPADIVEKILNKPDQGEADLVAARITAAISEFGWPNEAAAREAIGEKGWKVVELSGGWPDICKTTYDQMNWTRTNLAKIYMALGNEEEKLFLTPSEQKQIDTDYQPPQKDFTSDNIPF